MYLKCSPSHLQYLLHVTPTTCFDQPIYVSCSAYGGVFYTILPTNMSGTLGMAVGQTWMQRKETNLGCIL